MADTQDKVATQSKTKRLQRSSSHNLVCNKCCGCVPLRTGCLILAYLYLVIWIVIGIFYIIGIIVILIDIMSPTRSHPVNVKLVMMHSATLVQALVAIPLNVLLLIGLHKEKRRFVGLYVKFQLIGITINAIQLFVVMWYAPFLAIAIGLAMFGLNIYFTLVMRSQYLKMGATVSSEPVGLYKDGHVVITP